MHPYLGEVCPQCLASFWRKSRIMVERQQNSKIGCEQLSRRKQMPRRRDFGGAIRRGMYWMASVIWPAAFRLRAQY
jgi:hypothetical protein